MSDTTTTAQSVKSVAKEVGKIAVTSAAQTAVEVAGAITILLAVGFTVNKVQERRAKKAAALTVVPE